MKCIYCLKGKTQVNNSREIKNILTWRRRHCLDCRKIFTTKETPLADNLFVIKRNKSRQRFVYEKLFVSLFTIFNLKKHRDNGDDAKLAKKISERIIKTILASQKTREITSADLIILASNQLKKIDGFFADQYIHYSPYRREVALNRGVICR